MQLTAEIMLLITLMLESILLVSCTINRNGTLLQFELFLFLSPKLTVRSFLVPGVVDVYMDPSAPWGRLSYSIPVYVRMRNMDDPLSAQFTVKVSQVGGNSTALISTFITSSPVSTVFYPRGLIHQFSWVPPSWATQGNTLCLLNFTAMLVGVDSDYSNYPANAKSFAV